ncbi:uncharacterized protein VTP21DRAFT_5140 [Calcarisporiella thermophila]|uniref:uncharacterized protein n=1 Tax=Calcarisporiella thermophila TaxID=911321 RepID=UPI0037421764
MTMETDPQNNDGDIHFDDHNAELDLDVAYIQAMHEAANVNGDKSQGINEMNMEIDESNPSLLLRLFYQRFFPYRQYFQWLNYEMVPTKTFQNREFSFQLQNEAYLRYQSFDNMEELKKEIERLQPVKIDIGAVYKVKPKDKKMFRSTAFDALEKELVFDIDMTDYDDVRTCCKGGDICLKCWEFMTVAIKIIDVALRDDFGFEHLLWVYSGRRGVHCWVCDERARKLNNDERRTIVGYLEIIKGGAQQDKKVKLPSNLHPSVSRSLDVLKEHFERIILQGQNVLGEQQHWKKVLQLIPDESVRKALDEQWQEDDSKTSEQRWDDIDRELALALKNTKASARRQALQLCKRDIIFQYCYPRLDDKVTTEMKHLLKSPFCVHPGTGRVCVPIDPARCDEFNPLQVPTVAQLLNEVNTQGNGEGKRVPDWEVTSLKPYIKVFEDFLKGLLRDTRERKRDAAKDNQSMEF